MAERLTRNNKVSIYNQNNLETMYDKLAEIEDTMEEYGIESVEKLSNALEFAKVIENILSEYGIKDNEELDKKLADGKTWQKACELACEYMCKFVIPCPDIHRKECKSFCDLNKADCYQDYFYQQAKKEKEKN